jgi:hypothetical protein
MHVGMNSYQDQWAIFLAAVCEQTYAQFNDPNGKFVVPLNYTEVASIRAKSISRVWERFGFMLESSQEIIIAFRGTSSKTNWISDAIASQKTFKYIQEPCLTHRGFTDIYSSARDQIIAELNKLSTDKTLFVTGHSLGAALATLCAIDIAANTKFTSPYLFTYGSPRVGDPAFARIFPKYVKNSTRIANLFDVVTHAPPFIYKLPKREKTYYYSHVPSVTSLHFQNGSVAANHLIGSYFDDLSEQNPAYAKLLCNLNPGFCPVADTKSSE